MRTDTNKLGNYTTIRLISEPREKGVKCNDVDEEWVVIFDQLFSAILSRLARWTLSYQDWLREVTTHNCPIKIGPHYSIKAGQRQLLCYQVMNRPVRGRALLSRLVTILSRLVDQP